MSLPAGRPPRVRARAHQFYPSHPSSLPRNIQRGGTLRQAQPGQSPPAAAPGGIGWILGSSPAAAGTLGTSPGTVKAESSPSSSSLPLQQFQHPSYELLDRNGFQQMKYERWKQRCLDERAQTGLPSPDSLFQSLLCTELSLACSAGTFLNQLFAVIHPCGRSLSWFIAGSASCHGNQKQQSRIQVSVDKSQGFKHAGVGRHSSHACRVQDPVVFPCLTSLLLQPQASQCPIISVQEWDSAMR